MSELVTPVQPGTLPSPAEVRIAPATLRDLGGLNTFLQAAYVETYPNDRGITPEMFEGNRFRSYLREYVETRFTDPASRLLVARTEGGIVGTIGITRTRGADIAEMWGFYVRANRQGKGIGRLLLSALTDDEFTQPVRTVRLWVAEDSVKAKSFYEHNGFVSDYDANWDWPSWTDKRPHNQYWRMHKRIR